MPSQWDHKADKDLLLAIISNGDLKSISWPSIAQKMQAKQYTFTHEACRQHFQKIRKESRDGPGSTPTSGTKRARTNGNTTGTPRKGSKAHGSFAETTNDNDDDDEEFNATPIKKQRVVKKEEGKENGEEQTAYQFKIENGEMIDLENDDMYEV